MNVHSILETSLYADDLEAAEKFYTGVLGLQLYSKVPGRHVFFKCSNGMFLIFRAEKTRQPNPRIPHHGATGAGHVAFAIPLGEIGNWRVKLKENGIPVEKEVAWPGGGYSLYFRDPAGNSLELATPDLWQYDPEKWFAEP